MSIAPSLLSMSPLEISALTELANVGIGHATTALEQMTGISFSMDCPVVDSLPLERVLELLSAPEELAGCVFMPFEGDVEGHIAFLIPWSDACELWKALLGRAPERPDEIDEMYASTLVEVGNVINSSFLSALASMTETRLAASPPALAVDANASLLQSVAVEAEARHVVILAIQTRIHACQGRHIEAYFLAIPTVEGIRRLFGKLGL